MGLTLKITSYYGVHFGNQYYLHYWWNRVLNIIRGVKYADIIYYWKNDDRIESNFMAGATRVGRLIDNHD